MQPGFELKFLAKLRALAKLSNMILDDETIQMLDEMLKDLGYERLDQAVGKILLNRRASDRFPSIRDIREAAGVVMDDPKGDKELAAEIAERIWTALGRYGYTNPGQAAEYIGDLGWAAVRNSGGWNTWCNIECESQKPTYIAQARDLIMSLLRKDRAGVALDAVPIPPSEQISSPQKEKIAEALRIARGQTN